MVHSKVDRNVTEIYPGAQGGGVTSLPGGVSILRGWGLQTINFFSPTVRHTVYVRATSLLQKLGGAGTVGFSTSRVLYDVCPACLPEA